MEKQLNQFKIEFGPLKVLQSLQNHPIFANQYLDVDDAFRKAFLYGVHSFKEHGNPPHYGMNFPLKQSLVMSSLIQPFLPVFTKSDSDALQFKKTSWKNIKKFIKSLGQDRLILVKEGKDESIILDID